jgi:PEP-CTERM motif
MTTMSETRRGGLIAPLFAAFLVSVAPGPARADVSPLLPVTVDFNSAACATYGDFVSCSAQFLNLLNTGSTSGNSSYDAVHQASQGQLDAYLTIMVGGAAAVSNAEYRAQQGPNIDDAYRPSGQGTLTDYGTRRENAGTGPSPVLNSCNDPAPSVGGESSSGGTCSNLTAWDIGTAEMIGALSAGGVLHEMLIMFDNNQVGENATQLLRAWGMVCAYKSGQGPTGEQICFELFDQNGIADENSNGAVTGFTTGKTYGQFEDYNSNNLVTAHGAICVGPGPNNVIFDTAPCPAGYILVNNNLGSNETEFITKIPELDLLALAAAGFDRLAFQFQLYNQNDGFEDIYIIAGAPLQRVPEPGTLALAGLAMLGLVGAVRRRKAR